MSMACNENNIIATKIVENISFWFLHVWSILAQNKDFFCVCFVFANDL